MSSKSRRQRGKAQNRLSGDWVALRMMATVARLTDQRAASYYWWQISRLSCCRARTATGVYVDTKYADVWAPAFITPNVADTQHLVVQGEEVDLGAVGPDMSAALPQRREMLRRTAQDPVAQTQF